MAGDQLHRAGDPRHRAGDQLHRAGDPRHRAGDQLHRVRDAVMLGGVEGGGTKFVCVIGTGPDAILRTTRIEVTDWSTTLAAAVRFFREAVDGGISLDAIGIASFGPVELRGGTPGTGPSPTRPSRAGPDGHDRPVQGGLRIAGRLRHGRQRGRTGGGAVACPRGPAGRSCT